MSDRETVSLEAQSLLFKELLPGEQVLWKGKPERKAFLANIAARTMPIVLLLIYVLIKDVRSMIQFAGEFTVDMLFGPLLLAVVTLIWASSFITSGKRWKYTWYVATDRRILIQTWKNGIERTSVYFTQVTNLSLRHGTLDRYLGVGDIYINAPDEAMVRGRNRNTYIQGLTALEDLAQPETVYARLQSIIGGNF